MCGIAGIFNYLSTARVSENVLTRMRDSMSVRGPDGFGSWTSADRAVGLAHRRLTILDLTNRGAQPMATEDGSLQITYNGEIYNFRELRAVLESKGVRFRSGTDTEVLLELYRHEGTQFLHRLRGMFAFALWDSAKRSLFLARDPFGIKPLYFADDGVTLRFASQVKALLAGGEVERTLSSAGQVGFLLWGHVPEPHTVYKSIRSLPPGHAMEIREGKGARIWKYFDVLDVLANINRDDEEPATGLLPEATLRKAVEETVRYHMVADVPVGCFLSAGIDSNVLCSYAAAVVEGQHLEGVTLGFDEYLGTSKDEVPLAAESAGRLGVRHRVRMLGRPEFERDLERVLGNMDQPTVDGLNTYFVAKAAADVGLKVALSGVGGDELFGGYPSFYQVPQLTALCKRIPSSQALGVALRRIAAPLLKRTTSPKYASLLEYGSSFSGAYFLRRGLFMPWELPGILDAEVLREGLEELGSLPASDDRLSALQSPYARVMALEIQEYLQPRLLRDADWAGMAHSVEIRTPYVDAFLFRQIASLMGRFLVPPSKRDLAACSPKPLPPALIARRKSGFAIPVNEWLARNPASPHLGRGLRSWATILARRFDFQLSQPARHRAQRVLDSVARSSISEKSDEKSRIPDEAAPLSHKHAVGDARPPNIKRVLIYRLGSIGDTVVALPAIKLIARAFPNAERRVLTNFPVETKAAPVETILAGTGLVQGYIRYPLGTRRFSELYRLRSEIRAWRPDVVIYITAPRSWLRTMRDILFFRSCGISRVLGAPLTPDRYSPHQLDDVRRYESEAGRLARCIGTLGDARLLDPASWDLGLTIEETQMAGRALDSWPGRGRFISASIGTKADTKDWGTENWRALFGRVSALDPHLGVLLVGASDEFAVGDQVLDTWRGPRLNMCGRMTPRASAAAIERSVMFVGPDSGPMHLAAAVGVPCVAVFSARNKPGVWFPFGARNRIIYHQTDCFGCELITCKVHQKKCIRSIHVDEVLGAVVDTLSEQSRRLETATPSQ